MGQNQTLGQLDTLKFIKIAIFSDSNWSKLQFLWSLKYEIHQHLNLGHLNMIKILILEVLKGLFRFEVL